MNKSPHLLFVVIIQYGSMYSIIGTSLVFPYSTVHIDYMGILYKILDKCSALWRAGATQLLLPFCTGGCERVVLDALPSPVQSGLPTCTVGCQRVVLDAALSCAVSAANLRCWLSESCLRRSSLLYSLGC